MENVRSVRLRIDLAYDGAPFHGYARQPGFVTVQGTLEGALSRFFGVPVALTCAGRTDRGVHALAQVVHCDLPADRAQVQRHLIDIDTFARRLDQSVGDAITIWQARLVARSFNARFSATSRRYRYRIAEERQDDPLRRHNRWHVGERLDVAAMRVAAKYLIGEHDFKSLCRAVPGRTTMRRITALTIARVAPGQLHIVVTGNAFCHQQVRALVGCLVEVGRGEQPPDWVGMVRDAKDRSVAAPVLPAKGLTLEWVTYGPGIDAAPPIRVRDRIVTHV
ncbi:MAG: tRNA pseudouridine(38-40) synthase TruA [Nitriliruptoraceae bacterium]